LQKKKQGKHLDIGKELQNAEISLNIPLKKASLHLILEYNNRVHKLWFWEWFLKQADNEWLNFIFEESGLGINEQLAIFGNNEESKKVLMNVLNNVLQTKNQFEDELNKELSIMEEKLEKNVKKDFNIRLSDNGYDGKLKDTGETFNQGIQHQYKKLICTLTNKKLHLAKSLSDEDTEKLKTNWKLLIGILLQPFSANLIDQARKTSFFHNGLYDHEDIVCSSMKILTKFAQMKVFGIPEAKYAFSLIGINVLDQNEDELDLTSEVIFSFTIPNKRGIEINSENTNREVCTRIEKCITDALKNPLTLDWLTDLLKDDDIVSEYLKQNNKIPFEKIQINVIDIFPGSNNVIVHMKYLYFPEDPHEASCIKIFVQTLLEQLPSVLEVFVDTQNEMRLEDRKLSMVVQVGDKYWTWNNNNKLKKFLEDFVEKFRKDLAMKTDEINEIKEELRKMGMVPLSIARFLENLYSKDTIEFDLEPVETFEVETMRLQNIPLWPSEKIRIKDLPNKERFQLATIFRKNFKREICEEVIANFEVFQDSDIFLKLKREISKLDNFLSPYDTILYEYMKKDGTIGGLLKCLEMCTNCESMSSLPIEDMKVQVNKLKESFYTEWIKMYKIHKQVLCFMASYDDFKKAADNSKSTREVLVENLMVWNEEMKQKNPAWRPNLDVERRQDWLCSCGHFHWRQHDGSCFKQRDFRVDQTGYP